jgi:Txe/YoeB family toxin of Txe-Axe toxin-antitoxin module
MSDDLNLYNVDTLQELYAVSFWKAYKVWPHANSKLKSKVELVQAIKTLSDKIEGDYYANGN